MRRNYISPEFEFQRVFGTLNMTEQSTFFGSKMLEIEDNIQVLNENVIYFQLSNGEQLNLESESNLPQIVLDTVTEKNLNHTLKIDESQTQFSRLNNTKWILDINLKKLLRDYIFATMKKWRTFEGVQNNMTKNNNVNSALLEYIDKNVLNRYQFTKVEFFLKSVDLLNLGGLRWNNTFSSSIESPTNLFTKIETETDSRGLDIKLRFNQPDSASRFAFSYYFNLYFQKI